MEGKRKSEVDKLKQQLESVRMELTQKEFQLKEFLGQAIMQAGYYMVCCTFLGNCCVQAALLLYGSQLVLHHGMPSQTLLAFMLYQGQLLEYFNVHGMEDLARHLASEYEGDAADSGGAATAGPSAAGAASAPQATPVAKPRIW